MPTSRISVGCDLVHIPRLQRALEEQAGMREKLFTATELAGRSIESLAGLYAAKEAILKALDLQLSDMFRIEIGHSETGRPHVANLADFYAKAASVASCDISITHEKDYAMAVAIVLLTLEVKNEWVTPAGMLQSPLFK